VAGYLRSRGVAEIEDVTSEVFIAVFKGIGAFEGDWEQFRSWVFTIAHRRTVDSWRRSARAPQTLPLDEGDEVVPSAEDLALERLAGAEVIRLLAVLSRAQRDVLTLRFVADLSVEQVAAVLGKRPGAVKVLQHRAIKRLRDVTFPGPETMTEV
jgi:RNA polymerase sigma-70 factor, ECF subfamily